MSNKQPREMKGDIQVVDNVFVKMIPLSGVGDLVQGHAHTFDHITLLSVGKVLMTHDNGRQEYTAPCLIVTPKGITHQFENLADKSLICCIHAIRDGDDVDDVADPSISQSDAINLMTQFPMIVEHETAQSNTN